MAGPKINHKKTKTKKEKEEMRKGLNMLFYSLYAGTREKTVNLNDKRKPLWWFEVFTKIVFLLNAMLWDDCFRPRHFYAYEQNNGSY